MRCWNCKFRSTVRKQSNSAAALCSSWPFLMPDHPVSATVRTAWAVNSVRSRFGTHSSSNTRMSECQVSCLLNCCYGELARHAWEILQKFIQRIAALKVVQQRLKRHASSREGRHTPHNLRITRNSSFHRQLRYRKNDGSSKFEASCSGFYRRREPNSLAQDYTRNSGRRRDIDAVSRLRRGLGVHRV